jgi:hypothetical protein
MIPFEILRELFDTATEPWRGSYHVEPPTPQSIQRIQQELSITIPDDYIHIATNCPSYGVWLAGIGEDYDHAFHILRLNGVFHDYNDLPALPQQFVLLNHGHDGDCDCWDTREITASGEHSIVYVDVGSVSPEPSGKKFEDFRSYIENFSLHSATDNPNRKLRHRAKQLIEQVQNGI